MKQIRAAREPEVISEFLPGEYQRQEYHPDRQQADRQQYEALVMNGDLG